MLSLVAACVAMQVLVLAAGFNVYTGPGNCPYKANCSHPPGPLKNTISAFSHHNNKLTPLGMTDVGADPTWLTVSGNCLFTTLQGTTSIASYRINGAGPPMEWENHLLTVCRRS